MLNCHNQHSTLMNNSDKESISPNNNNSSADVAPNTRKSTLQTFKRAFLSDEQSHMQNESKLNDNIDEYYEFGDSDESDDEGIEIDNNSSSSDSDEQLKAASVLSTISSRRTMSAEESKQKQIATEKDENAGWKTESTPSTTNEFTLTRQINTRGRLEREIDFFNLFIDDSIMNEWVEATNKNALNSNYKHGWRNTNLAEIKHFIAVVIYMGMHDSPTIHDYFSELSSSPFVTNLFSRDRFCQLYRQFYMNNGERDREDRIWHVRPFADELKKRFHEFYQPSRVLVVDESMCHTKARLNMKQYIPAKPYKWGIKIWCIENEGYLLDFIAYQGALSEIDSHTPKEALLQLVQRYHGFHHLVVMDGLFTFPELFNDFLTKKTYCLGVVRPNRVGFPKSIVYETSNLQRLQSTFRQNKQLVVHLYIDKKPLYVMTTFHSAIATTTVTRHHFPHETVTTNIPTAIEDYNKHRCGVDRVDQMETYYRLGRRTKRWWLRLAWWLLDVVINNSWRLYQLKMNSNMKSHEFRTKLMQQLSEDKPIRTTRINRKRLHANIDNSSLAHLPVLQQERARCVVCTRQKLNHRGYMKCVTCNVYLCANRDCFVRYHSQ